MPVPKPLKALVFTVVVLLVIAAVVLVWRDFWSRRSPNQALFTRGTVPSPMPEGDYQGSVNGYSGSWIGKTFDAKHAAGKNRFKTPAGGVELQYPFKTEVGLGVADAVKVVKIDYDIPENPVWLRRILDEIVQVGPNHFLGKVHLRWGPVHLTVGYFELTK
jgi:hypothetical protein